MKAKVVRVILLCGIFLLTACRTETNEVRPITVTQMVRVEVPGEPVEKVVTTVATPESENKGPEPLPDTLVVCTASEPVDLLVKQLISQRNIQSAIFDGPFDLLNFEYVPVILAKTPRFEDGDALIQSVEVEAGDVVLDVNGEPVALIEGVQIRPAGCYERACEQTYQGGALKMDQMAITFQLLEGLKWSDGELLTSDDSLYGFEVFSDPDSWRQPADRRMIDRTQSYTALDERTIVWIGIPGYLESSYPLLFFAPMPRHAWGGLTPAEIQTMPEITRAPLGWGPYVVDEWVLGDHLRLRRNEFYFRADEGLPKFETLIFRFVDNTDAGLAGVLAGECDVLLGAPEDQLDFILQLADEGLIQAQIAPSSGLIALVFGMESAPGYEGFAATGAFGNVELRRAVVECMDREMIVATTTAGQGIVPDSFLPLFHPYVNPDVRHYSFNPASAIRRLESIGWVDDDSDPNTPRVAQGVADVPDGTLLSFTITTHQSSATEQVLQLIQQNVFQCGIEVNLEFLPGNVLLAPGPDGPLRGRQFDMALITATLDVEPPCEIVLSEEIPGEDQALFPQGWLGMNWAGYRNPEYDRACLNALGALPGSPEKLTFHLEAQSILFQDLPLIPLKVLLKISISRPDACGVVQDPSALSWTWNIEAFGFGALCEE